MKFKKVYIEITNKCNLNCSFCSIDNLPKREMSIEEFRYVLNEIKPYTDYIYLHVKGEPLIHSKFEEILSVCKEFGVAVNITTNGVFIKEKINSIIESNAVRQINISLHSENKKENYIEDIIDSVKDIKNIYINYRFWTLENDELDDRMKCLKNKLEIAYNSTGNKLDDNTFIDYSDKFVWPDMANNYFEEYGRCYGLNTHIGVLVDGTVTICCLDSRGISNLGNIFEKPLKEILESDKVKRICDDFKNNRCFLDICKHCSYKERFSK